MCVFFIPFFAGNMNPSLFFLKLLLEKKENGCYFSSKDCIFLYTIVIYLFFYLSVEVVAVGGFTLPGSFSKIRLRNEKFRNELKLEISKI